MNYKANRLIWIDLEMTGLNVETDTIIEIATLVTDYQLNVVSQGPVIAISHPDYILNNMDDWNTKHHTKSGLVDRVKASNVTLEEAEEKTLAFLKEHVSVKDSPMCGNSIHQDRKFLETYMPRLGDFFHYRHLDVSTLKILANMWDPDIAKKLTKKSQHLALEDIKDSIDELNFYREHMLKV